MSGQSRTNSPTRPDNPLFLYCSIICSAGIGISLMLRARTIFSAFPPAAAAATVLRANAVKCSPTHSPSFPPSLPLSLSPSLFVVVIARIGFGENTWIGSGEIASAAAKRPKLPRWRGPPQGGLEGEKEGEREGRKDSRRPSVRRQNKSGASGSSSRCATHSLTGKGESAGEGGACC